MFIKINAVYARYIENTLESLEKGSSQRLRELQINFQHAGQLGDEIPCSGVLDGGSFCIRGDSFFAAGGTLTT